MNFLYDTFSATLDDKIETRNLLLRPYQEGDESDFMRLLKENTSSIGPAFTGRVTRVHALEDARMQIMQLRSNWDNRKTFEFGIWQKNPEAYIGDIALKNLDRCVPKAELGLYFTGVPENKELVQEALQAVVRFAFESLGLNKVYLRCAAFNEFYGKLAITCGFVKEGTLRNDFRGADSEELFDLDYYGLTRQDFEQAQQNATASSTAIV